MRAALTLTMIAGLTVTGCARFANSSFNPVNWFGPSTAAAPVEGAALQPLVPQQSAGPIDTRPLVSAVTALRVDRTPTGAIIVAQGEVPTQGFFNAELVKTSVAGGVLTLAFRAEAPTGFEAVGAAPTRTLTSALEMSTGDLAGINTIRVEGQTNARTAAR